MELLFFFSSVLLLGAMAYRGLAEIYGKAPDDIPIVSPRSIRAMDFIGASGGASGAISFAQVSDMLHQNEMMRARMDAQQGARQSFAIAPGLFAQRAGLGPPSGAGLGASMSLNATSPSLVADARRHEALMQQLQENQRRGMHQMADQMNPWGGRPQNPLARRDPGIQDLPQDIQTLEEWRHKHGAEVTFKRMKPHPLANVWFPKNEFTEAKIEYDEFEVNLDVAICIARWNLPENARHRRDHSWRGPSDTDRERMDMLVEQFKSFGVTNRFSTMEICRKEKNGSVLIHYELDPATRVPIIAILVVTCPSTNKKHALTVDPNQFDPERARISSFGLDGELLENINILQEA